MDPKIVKAREVKAREETVKAIQGVEGRLDRLEAKIERVLELLEPSAHPKPPKKAS